MRTNRVKKHFAVLRSRPLPSRSTHGVDQQAHAERFSHRVKRPTLPIRLFASLQFFPVVTDHAPLRSHFRLKSKLPKQTWQKLQAKDTHPEIDF